MPGKRPAGPVLSLRVHRPLARSRRMPRYRVRRAGAVVATLVAMAVVAGGAVAAVRLTGSGSPTSGPPPPVTSTGPSPSTGTTATTTDPAPLPIGTYSVATTSLVAVDTSIPTTTPRSLPTTVWYPSGPASAGARAAPGPYPLVIFSQGFAQAPTRYLDLISAWASAGFVVAAPTYPDTDPKTTAPNGPTPSRAGLVYHPADLAAVVSAVESDGSEAQSPLHGLVDAREIGLAGQSDGGDASLAAGANTCCRLTSAKAMVILSGAEYDPYGGAYFSSPSPPLLVVQGDADPVNPPSCSTAIYDAAPSPKYYLDLLGATHLVPYETPTSAWEPVVATVTTDFLQAVLDGRAQAGSALDAAGNVAGISTLTVGGTVPPVTTPPCPQTSTPS